MKLDIISEVVKDILECENIKWVKKKKKYLWRELA